MPMDALGGILVVLFFIALAVVGTIWHFSRSTSVLEAWARRNGYRIVAQDYRSFFKGPFFWTSSKSQTVYRITVEDGHGNLRSGWVRCGGWFFGLWSDHADVQWDEPE
jgi:hypothetical protein